MNEYIHPLLKKNAFMMTYQHRLHPVSDENIHPLFLHDNLLPLIVTRVAGRPQTKRKKKRMVKDNTTTKNDIDDV